MTADDNADDLLINSSDPGQSREFVESYLQQKQQELVALGDAGDALERAGLLLDIAEAMVGVDRGEEAWGMAREAFGVFLQHEQWENAVKCCDVLYQSAQPASLLALGQGVWLAVTYPIDPQLSVNMLGYIIDETPPKADGAAIAAITAHYIADMRTEGKTHDSLTFLTKEMLGNVAKAHSDVKDQEAMNLWLERLQLLDPGVFLPRLSLVIGAIVPADQWWFDREALRDKIPD